MDGNWFWELGIAAEMEAEALKVRQLTGRLDDNLHGGVIVQMSRP